MAYNRMPDSPLSEDKGREEVVLKEYFPLMLEEKITVVWTENSVEIEVQSPRVPTRALVIFAGFLFVFLFGLAVLLFLLLDHLHFDDAKQVEFNALICTVTLVISWVGILSITILSRRYYIFTSIKNGVVSHNVKRLFSSKDFDKQLSDFHSCEIDYPEPPPPEELERDAPIFGDPDNVIVTFPKNRDIDKFENAQETKHAFDENPESRLLELQRRRFDWESNEEQNRGAKWATLNLREHEDSYSCCCHNTGILHLTPTIWGHKDDALPKMLMTRDRINKLIKDATVVPAVVWHNAPSDSETCLQGDG